MINVTTTILPLFINRTQEELYLSQTDRQGLAAIIYMASVVVLLTHETSTLRQSHDYISINLKFGVGDCVREVTSPDKVGLDPMSGRVSHMGATYTGHVIFIVFLVFYVFFNSTTAHTCEPIFAQNSSNDAVWCKEDPFWDDKCVVVRFGGCVTLKTPLKWVSIGNYHPK